MIVIAVAIDVAVSIANNVNIDVHPILENVPRMRKCNGRIDSANFVAADAASLRQTPMWLPMLPLMLLLWKMLPLLQLFLWLMTTLLLLLLPRLSLCCLQYSKLILLSACFYLPRKSKYSSE